MPEDKSYHLWLNADDKTAVQAMLHDTDSGHWKECLDFVTMHVRDRAKAQGIADGHWDDIVQEVMIRIYRSLPFFKFRSAFGTWVFTIISNCTTDFHRKSKYIKQQQSLRDEAYTDDGEEGDVIVLAAFMTTEEAFLIRELLLNTFEMLNEYITTHAKPERNRQILKMFLFEGRSLEEIARVVDCSAPVAGYVVRSAQRYVREKMDS